MNVRSIGLLQPILNTERLLLEPFKDTDLDDIYIYASDPDVAKTVSWDAHKNLEDSREYLNWIQRQTSGVSEKIFFVWAIREKASGKVIGSIDFKNLQAHSGQFDYAIGKSYWNNGYATEATKEVLNWAFDAIPNLQRIQAFCIAENQGSRRVMEKAGLQFEGVRKKSIQSKGQIFDTAHYALVK